MRKNCQLTKEIPACDKEQGDERLVIAVDGRPVFEGRGNRTSVKATAVNVRGKRLTLVHTHPHSSSPSLTDTISASRFFMLYKPKNVRLTNNIIINEGELYK